EVERVVGELDDLDQPTVRRQAREPHSALREQLAVRVVELVPMPMTLENDRLCVRAGGERAIVEDARVTTQAHRSALLVDVSLLGQQVDDRMRRERIELRRVR